jgi:hypothetical protein
MRWNEDAGGGGLGVLVRDTGLVKPPSLVSSAVVTLLLLHVEIVDMPRMGLLSENSSVGELAFEPPCSAEVRSDCCRSQRGFDLVNDVLEEYWSFSVVGRGVRPKGGSSPSATTSSSDVVFGGVVLGTFCAPPISNAPRRLTCSCSFAMAVDVRVVCSVVNCRVLAMMQFGNRCKAKTYSTAGVGGRSRSPSSGSGCRSTSSRNDTRSGKVNEVRDGSR